TLSLHDALPISAKGSRTQPPGGVTSRTIHRRSARGLTVGCATPSTLGRSLLGALAWYLKTGKNLAESPSSAACDSSSTTFVGQRPLLTSFIAPLRPVPARQLYVPWPSAFVPKAGCGTAACAASAAP